MVATKYAQGQLDTTKNFTKQAIRGSERIIKSIVGDRLYKKHFRLDSLDSHDFRTFVYTRDIKNSKLPGRDTCFSVVYFVIQSKDTIGYLNMYMNQEGYPLNDFRDPASNCTPELIVGYKRVLTNGFKVNYQKAVKMAKERGFNEPPYLNTETDYNYLTVANKTFIKVKYFWAFVLSDPAKGNAVLNINAETGKIEKEAYSTAMPY